MQKIKKGEIVIYAVALMLVTAGYFNYMTFEKSEDIQETYSEDVQSINDETEEFANVGDAVLVSNNEVNEINENDKEELEEVNKSNETSNELVETNAQEENKEDEKENGNDETTNYYAESKLDRDKMYAEMIKSYEEILNNTNVSEAQKSIATQEITKINNTKNAIMIIENLILTKGFNNCLLLINESIVEIVVNVTGGLDTSKVAQIQNIVTRELDVQIENIHITEK